MLVPGLYTRSEAENIITNLGGGPLRLAPRSLGADFAALNQTNEGILNFF